MTVTVFGWGGARGAPELMAACLIPLFGTAILAALGPQIGNMLLVPVE